MKKTIFTGHEKRKVWFDLECKESRKILRQHLRKFCKSVTKIRLSYSQKKEGNIKKQSHKRNILHSLQTHIKDPKKVWNTIRLVRNKPGGN